MLVSVEVLLASGGNQSRRAAAVGTEVDLTAFASARTA